jgi:hypothetical protein
LIPPDVVHIIGYVISAVILYFLFERKIEKKISKYVGKFRSSQEGKDAVKILEETRKLIESGELSKLVDEFRGVAEDARVVLKALKEKLEPHEEDEDDEDDVDMPSLLK